MQLLQFVCCMCAYPLTSAATSGLYIGLELDRRLTEPHGYYYYYYLLLRSYIKYIKSYTQLYSRHIRNSIHKLIT